MKDQQIFDIIRRERERQTKGIELIASENYVSDQVLSKIGAATFMAPATQARIPKTIGAACK